MSRGCQIIRIKNACKYWGFKDIQRVILQDIDLSIYLGESLSIMGPSGAGKSTLLHILGFLTPLDKGSIWFGDQLLTSKKDQRDHKLRSNIGFVFQDAKLIPELNILENVCVPLVHRGVRPSVQKCMAREALHKVGLNDLHEHRTNQISGGELMRVAIARAIVQNPKVILADEPTGTLDSHNGEIIAELLITMATPNCSVVFVTHSRDFALKADRIMYLKDGCLDVT